MSFFRLSFQQLSKYTDAGHPDSFHIENALEIMKQMINVLNDSIQGSCKLANNGSRKGLKAKKWVEGWRVHLYALYLVKLTQELPIQD